MKLPFLGYALIAAAMMSVGIAKANAASPEPAAAAWNARDLRAAIAALPAGKAERGKLVHQELLCASCHGEAGVAPTQNWPHLAGQRAIYTAKLLLDYRDRRHLPNRGALLMHDIAVMMTPQQIADVAEYYAALPLPGGDTTPRPRAQVDVQQLVRKGDPSRLLTPCASCHGTQGQGGKNETPALAGQNPLFFVRTMLDYQSGKRQNDANQSMSTFAKKLSRVEIEALASYYADLPTHR